MDEHGHLINDRRRNRGRRGNKQDRVRVQHLKVIYVTEKRARPFKLCFAALPGARCAAEELDTPHLCVLERTSQRATATFGKGGVPFAQLCKSS